MNFGVVIFLVISFVTWANAIRRRDGSFFNSTVDVVCLALLFGLSSAGVKVEMGDVVAVLTILGLDLAVVLAFR